MMNRSHLKERRCQMNQRIRSLQKENDNINKEIQNVNLKIYDTCKHSWIRDPYSYGPYEKCYMLCTKCKLNDNREMYK
jgi:hypothetical protein